MSDLRINRLAGDETGIVSILVVSILTITLALIAVGFSKLADRELTQASDRELSSQAYYAAQSGVNDAIAYLEAGGTSFSGCTNWPQAPVNGNNYFAQELDPTNPGTAKYSCIGVNNSPQTLSATSLTPGKPQVLEVSASGLNELYISWQNSNSPNGPLGAAYTLPRENALPAAGATGLLRVGLYEVPQSSSPANCNTGNTNTCLSDLSRVYYLYPNSGAGVVNCAIGSLGSCADYTAGGYSTVSGPSGKNGSFVKGNCKASSPNPVPANTQAPKSYYCNSAIINLTGTNASGTGNVYYLYLTSQYSTLNVSIQGVSGPNSPVSFVNSQAVIDVTGQGSDVIQRIRTTVGLTSNFDYPAYAVQSMQTLCKAFNVPITGLKAYGSATAPDSANDPACVAPSGTGSVTGGGTGGHP